MKNEIKETASRKELESYVHMKEAEVENEKLCLKIDHMNKINNEYKIETEIMTNIITNACEVIQDNYLLLRSLNELDNETLDKYQKLVKMLQGQRSVKFADDENNLTTNITDENLANGEDHHFLESPSMISRKRAKEAESTQEDLKKSKNDFPFARPKALKSINFEPFAPSTSQASFEMNSTFSLDSEPPPILNERTNSLAPGSKFAPKSESYTACSNDFINFLIIFSGIDESSFKIGIIFQVSNEQQGEWQKVPKQSIQPYKKIASNTESRARKQR